MNSWPDTWKSTELGSLGKWGSGGTPKVSETAYYNGSIPWIRSGDLPDGSVEHHSVSLTLEGLRNSAARMVPEGAILIALYGATLGKLGITTYPVATNQAVAFCIPNELTSTKFLFWHLLNIRQELISLGKGGAQPNISQTILKSHRLALPPIDEQQRIVAKLDCLFAKSHTVCEELARVPRLVERYKEAILEAAFNGQITEDWRSSNCGIEDAATLISRTPQPKQPRGGREASESTIPGVGALSVNHPKKTPPGGWEWVLLNRIARQESGHTPSRSHPEWWGGDIPWIGIKDAGAHHGRTIFDTIQKTNPLGLANSSARLLPANTVCLSRTASVGYVIIMGKPMATSQDFVTWSCSEALDPHYLMYALMAEGEEIRRFGKGSTHTTIYFPEVRALHICLAPLAEQREIVRRIESAFKKIDRLAAERNHAAALLDRLDQATLTKAFRGDLLTR